MERYNRLEFIGKGIKAVGKTAGLVTIGSLGVSGEAAAEQTIQKNVSFELQENREKRIFGGLTGAVVFGPIGMSLEALGTKIEKEGRWRRNTRQDRELYEKGQKAIAAWDKVINKSKPSPPEQEV